MSFDWQASDIVPLSVVRGSMKLEVVDNSTVVAEAPTS